MITVNLYNKYRVPVTKQNQQKGKARGVRSEGDQVHASKSHLSVESQRLQFLQLQVVTKHVTVT